MSIFCKKKATDRGASRQSHPLSLRQTPRASPAFRRLALRHCPGSRDDGPAVRPGSSGSGREMAPLITPARGRGQDLISIDARKAGTVAKSGSGGHTDPYAFWMDYYRTKDEKKTEPERLRETVSRLLNQRQDPRRRCRLAGVSDPPGEESRALDV